MFFGGFAPISDPDNRHIVQIIQVPPAEGVEAEGGILDVLHGVADSVEDDEQRVQRPCVRLLGRRASAPNGLWGMHTNWGNPRGFTAMAKIYHNGRHNSGSIKHSSGMRRTICGYDH